MIRAMYINVSTLSCLSEPSVAVINHLTAQIELKKAINKAILNISLNSA